MMVLYRLGVKALMLLKMAAAQGIDTEVSQFRSAGIESLSGMLWESQDL